MAILLMFLTEKDAFWVLAQLMTDERHAMHGRSWTGCWTGLELRRVSLQGYSRCGAGGDPHTAHLTTGKGNTCLGIGHPQGPGARATGLTIQDQSCTPDPPSGLLSGCLFTPQATLAAHNQMRPRWQCPPPPTVYPSLIPKP